MNRIAKLRRERGLSQADLAKIIGVHQTAVSQWEKERTTPSFEAVMALSEFFNVSPNYLLGRDSVRVSFRQEEKDDDTVTASDLKSLADCAQNSLNKITDTSIETIKKQCSYILSNGGKNNKTELTETEYRLLLAMLKTLREQQSEKENHNGE